MCLIRREAVKRQTTTYWDLASCVSAPIVFRTRNNLWVRGG